MKIHIFTNFYEESIKIGKILTEKLVSVGYELDSENPDLIITLGGDGTVLAAFHKYQHLIDTVKFVGIHTGTLGFYTDFLKTEIDEFVTALQTTEGQIVEFPLLQVKICSDDKCLEYLALNETTIVSPLTTLKMDVFINDTNFESFNGTGLCISTPSGSSAYNKSLGGAVISPALRAYQVTEIASINNNVYRTLGSSFILDETQVVKLESNTLEAVVITVDNIHINFDNVNSIEYSMAKSTIKFIHYRDYPFYQRIKDAFIGEQ